MMDQNSVAMSNSNKNGISAITAATMIATGSIGDQKIHNFHTPIQTHGERRESLWNMITSRKNSNGIDKNSKTRSISYAFGSMKSPFVEFGITPSHQEVERMSTKVTEQMKAESLSNIAATISSSYAILLICIFIAFSFSGLVTFPLMYRWLDIHGFFVYLYFISCIYLLYLIIHVMKVEKRSEEEKLPKVVENIESHGSFAVRIGCLIFGTGFLMYHVIEFIQFLETLEFKQGPCYHPTYGLSSLLALMFGVLQTYVIFMYPRTNINCHKIFNRLGMMHLVATNLILWIEAICKESVEEIIEHEKEQMGVDEFGLGSKLLIEANETNENASSFSCNSSLTSLMDRWEKEEEICKKFRVDLIDGFAIKASAILSAFVIEYVLIGASMAFMMSKHIGVLNNDDTEILRGLHKPRPKEFIKKVDCRDSMKGIICGVCIFLIAVVDICLFFGFNYHAQTKDEAEMISMVYSTLVNASGIVACTYGMIIIQNLHKMTKNEQKDVILYHLDNTLLKFSSIFIILYDIFTVIVGSFADETKNEFHIYDIHIFYGMLEIIQVIFQIIFLLNLGTKKLTAKTKTTRPGRQITIFLFLFNLSLWLVYTFEIQKARASVIEAEFYGFFSWVIIQRVTLPMAIFFRFHSSVVSISLWKEVYRNDELAEEISLNRCVAKTRKISRI